jgi:hypothetical protein
MRKPVVRPRAAINLAALVVPVGLIVPAKPPA